MPRATTSLRGRPPRANSGQFPQPGVCPPFPSKQACRPEERTAPHRGRSRRASVSPSAHRGCSRHSAHFVCAVVCPCVPREVSHQMRRKSTTASVGNGCVPSAFAGLLAPVYPKRSLLANVNVAKTFSPRQCPCARNVRSSPMPMWALNAVLQVVVRPKSRKALRGAVAAVAVRQLRTSCAHPREGGEVLLKSARRSFPYRL